MASYTNVTKDKWAVVGFCNGDARLLRLVSSKGEAQAVKRSLKAERRFAAVKIVGPGERKEHDC